MDIKKDFFKTFSLTKFILVLIHSFMGTRILYLLNCQICKGFTECFAFMIFSIFEAQWEAILQNRKWFIRNIAHQDKLKTINMFLFKTLKNKKQYNCDKITNSKFPLKLKWLFLKCKSSDHKLLNSNSF